MAKRKSVAETQRLKQQMVDAASKEEQVDAFEKELAEAEPETGDSDNVIFVYRSIHKGFQRITEGIPVRVPTNVLEWVEDHIEEKAERITVLYRLLELGKEVMQAELDKGDVVIKYPRK